MISVEKPTDRPDLKRETSGTIVEETEPRKRVRKAELHSGDLILVRTAHSTYRIRVLGDGLYSVSGGWFDRRGLSPFKTTITGCTWGRSAVKLDTVAACGLHLEEW